MLIQSRNLEPEEDETSNNKGRSNHLPWLTHCRPENGTIDNANEETVQEYQYERNENDGEFFIECRCRGRDAILIQSRNHEPEEDETSTNKGRSNHLPTADQRTEPSIMQTKRRFKNTNTNIRKE